MYSPLPNFLKNPNKKSNFDKDFDTNFAKVPEKKILYHSTSIVAFQIRRILLPLLKSYLMPSRISKAL